MEIKGDGETVCWGENLETPSLLPSESSIFHFSDPTSIIKLLELLFSYFGRKGKKLKKELCNFWLIIIASEFSSWLQIPFFSVENFMYWFFRVKSINPEVLVWAKEIAL